jgi:hypothetical protein
MNTNARVKGWLGLAAAALTMAANFGCQSGGAVERVADTHGDSIGRTYYIDGAGNLGYGVKEIQHGLRKAGYAGRIINYTWSPTLNPALDQTIGRGAAKRKGQELGEEISAYLAANPGAKVNIIALSAGTGVAAWACEHVRGRHRVNNVVLLGSSLSSTYDMSRALEHVAGKVYVYYSSKDAILSGAVRMLGTIDGASGVDSAGLIGLKAPRRLADRVVNVGWSPSYERFGWHGGHTDSTSEPFVTAVLASHVVTSDSVTVASAEDTTDRTTVSTHRPI